jgi:hypothetical protein
MHCIACVVMMVTVMINDYHFAGVNDDGDRLFINHSGLIELLGCEGR